MFQTESVFLCRVSFSRLFNRCDDRMKWIVHRGLHPSETGNWRRDVFGKALGARVCKLPPFCFLAPTQVSLLTHRQPKLNIREPLNYKDLCGNTTDLCKMAETNIVFSIKSTYPVSTCILRHLSAFEADSKRFRRVSVIRDSTVKCNERPNSISAMLEARNGINPLKSSLVSQFLYRIKVEMHIYPASATPTQLKLYHVC